MGSTGRETTGATLLMNCNGFVEVVLEVEDVSDFVHLTLVDSVRVF